MNERATPTRDFLNVDSFSQLPFIRRDHKPPNAPIRLFGFDFPPHPPTSSDTNKLQNAAKIDTIEENGIASEASEALRKFECNYCFRNFPTSQALGGHQNAHKRERQHAKRAHLAAAAAEGHLRGIIGYHRIGFSAAAATAPLPPMQHGGGGVRFYGGLGSVAQPINGSPMLGLWRNPAAQLGLFSGHEERSMIFSTHKERNGYNDSKGGVSLDLHL